MSAQSITQLDADILTVFREDARIPISQIADRLKVPESTVRHRVTRMTEKGLLQFSAWVNPTMLRDHVWVLIGFMVDFGHVDQITSRLAEIDEIYFLGICTGAFDIQATAVFPSNDALYEFLKGPVAQIPGIQRINTTTVIRQVKRSAIHGDPQRLVTDGRRK